MNAEQYKELSIREFTKAASVYDSGHAGIYELCKDDYPPILEELECRDFQDLLDVGCGTGPMIELLTQKYPDRHFTGLDITPKMIEVAKAKKLPNATFVVGDSENLPFADDSFDVVICANSFHHYPNPQKFVDGVKRVLRPNGVLVLRDYTTNPVMLWMINHIELKLANLFGRGDVCVYSLDAIREMCGKAGLGVVKLQKGKMFRLHLVATNGIGEITASADYKNWVPKGMVYGLLGGAVASAAGCICLGALGHGLAARVASSVLGVAALGCSVASAWSIFAYQKFSYNGNRRLSKQIVDGVAEHVHLPENGVCLDVGCGSGALTIAVARRNPQGKVIGCDRWGKEYASFSLRLCERNAQAENVHNVEFTNGDATCLPFDDECFDCVTSNYVYHNIAGDRQKWLLETLRVLKKGGTFVIHDIMDAKRYGDMKAFVQKLRGLGYESVELVRTADRFMTPWEARLLGLGESALLYGRK